MMEKKPIVYVVDDDPSVRKALERLLRVTGYRVETFASPREFLDCRHSDAPGCLILDIRMPDLSGIELQERLADTESRFPIVFVTGHGTIPISVQAMKGGAVDFLQKPFSDHDLLDAVSRGIEKDRRTKRDQLKLRKLRHRIETLTPREYEVFRLVVAGMLNKQIAFKLGTTEKTIKVHRARVMEKMAADSFADLVRFAERLGIHRPCD